MNHYPHDDIDPDDAQKQERREYYSVVYRGIQAGEEASDLFSHPKAVHAMWGHAIRERDRALSAAPAEPPRAPDRFVMTHDQTGPVALTRQDDEGRMLEVIWERPTEPPRAPEAQRLSAKIAQHELRAGDCPSESMVVLSSSLRRLSAALAAPAGEPRDERAAFEAWMDSWSGESNWRNQSLQDFWWSSWQARAALEEKP